MEFAVRPGRSFSISHQRGPKNALGCLWSVGSLIGPLNRPVRWLVGSFVGTPRWLIGFVETPRWLIDWLIRLKRRVFSSPFRQGFAEETVVETGGGGFGFRLN